MNASFLFLLVILQGLLIVGCTGESNGTDTNAGDDVIPSSEGDSDSDMNAELSRYATHSRNDDSSTPGLSTRIV